jgi:hypothetical protein
LPEDCVFALIFENYSNEVNVVDGVEYHLPTNLITPLSSNKIFIEPTAVYKPSIECY